MKTKTAKPFKHVGRITEEHVTPLPRLLHAASDAFVTRFELLSRDTMKPESLAAALFPTVLSIIRPALREAFRQSAEELLGIRGQS